VPVRGIEVRTEIAGPAEVAGDPELLGSALTNLVQNAVKFTHAGGVVVIRTAVTERTLTIEVEDECGGLPTDRADELFKPFVQRSTDRSGIGLGLAIARAAIEAHRGTLRVRNLPGQGCVFAITLPRATA
jgi:signal transduction histidine kinase